MCRVILQRVSVLFLCLCVLYILEPFKLQLFVSIKFCLQTSKLIMYAKVRLSDGLISIFLPIMSVGKIKYREAMHLTHYVRREQSSGTYTAFFCIRAASPDVFVANSLLLLVVIENIFILRYRHNQPQKTGI